MLPKSSCAYLDTSPDVWFRDANPPPAFCSNFTPIVPQTFAPSSLCRGRCRTAFSTGCGNVWPVTLFKPVTCTPHSSAAATDDVVIGILVGLKQLVAAWPTEFVTFKEKKSLRADYRQVRLSQVTLENKWHLARGAQAINLKGSILILISISRMSVLHGCDIAILLRPRRRITADKPTPAARSERVRSGQPTTGQDKSVQFQSGKGKSGQIRSGHP